MPRLRHCVRRLVKAVCDKPLRPQHGISSEMAQIFKARHTCSAGQNLALNNGNGHIAFRVGKAESGQH